MGDGRVGMVDARDVAAVAARVLTDDPDQHHGKTDTLTGPRAIRFTEAAQQLGHASGNEVSYLPATHQDARQALLETGVPRWIADMLIEPPRGTWRLDLLGGSERYAKEAAVSA
jgi:uncharacterized protein YbjT (DUF2867 family)